MSYEFLKLMHILGAAVLFGTGMGIAFFMYMAVRTGETATIAATARLVVVADYVFTLTAALLQPITGLLLLYQTGYGLTDFWVVFSLLLYLLVGGCWVPVVFMQREMHALALRAATDGAALPGRFYLLYKRWLWLGWPAFLSMLLIFWLMITRPQNWAELLPIAGVLGN